MKKENELEKNDLSNVVITIIVVSLVALVFLIGIFGETFIKHQIRKTADKQLYECILVEKESKSSGALLGSHTEFLFTLKKFHNKRSGYH